MTDEEDVDEEGMTVTVMKKRTANLGEYNSATAMAKVEGVPVEDDESFDEAIDRAFAVANEKVHEDLEKEVAG